MDIYTKEEGGFYISFGSSAGLSATVLGDASDQEEAQLGYSVGTAGDVNGDGYSDVIVGEPYYDGGQIDEGQVHVYYGSEAGLATTHWTQESDQGGAEFGHSVGVAGDVNGDGYADVIIGAPFYDRGVPDCSGRIYIYHGSATGLATSPAWDYYGGLTGYAVGTAGDVNGDGYADIIFGANTNVGVVGPSAFMVYSGSMTGLHFSHKVESDQVGDGFGESVWTAGDVNGDGYADVIVGALRYENGQSKEGRAYVYHGAVDGLAITSAWDDEGDQDYAYFGYAARTAGDVNGDGYADVIASAPGFDGGRTNEGVAYVYHGSAAGLATSPTCTLEGIQGGIEFGFSAGTAGDVNDDGYDDVIVGARYYDDHDDQIDEGAAFVYYGSATGLTTTRAWTGQSDQAGAWYGYAVGTAGDVNGDGYADVIVGARLRLPRLRERACRHAGLDRRERPGQCLLWLDGRDGRGRGWRRLLGCHRRGIRLRRRPDRRRTCLRLPRLREWACRYAGLDRRE
jgi:hypothetical protein